MSERVRVPKSVWVIESRFPTGKVWRVDHHNLGTFEGQEGAEQAAESLRRNEYRKPMRYQVVQYVRAVISDGK